MPVSNALPDYIVVGAGSSGCVLAAELTTDPARTVLLIEGGGSDRGFLVDMPRGLAKLLEPGSRYVREYDVRRGGNRGTERWMKGRVLGGSSSVNGMIYARGFPSDYDRWAALGCPGWGWSDMVRHFKAIEDHELGETDERGADGPLRVSGHPIDAAGGALCEAVIEAAVQAGTPRVADTNAAPDGGIAYQARTIWRGKRQSAAKAFLRPAMKRPNLTVASDTEVLRIVFDGRTAVGVEVRDKHGIRTIRAGREVILCAGALESPKLLQLSGVGPGKLLRDLDIAVVHDQPQVGQNLREHFYLQTKFRVNEGGLNQEFAGLRLLRNVLRYLFTSAGPMSHAAQELVGYIRSRDGLPRPNCQIGVGLYSLADGPKGLALETEPGFTIGGYFMHPRSRGETFITSPDAAAAPFVDANYLAEAEDRIASVGMVRAIRRIVAQPALAGIVCAELAPGLDVQSDDAILDDLYARGGTAFHVSGTCRMGSDDAAVTDPAGRVRGVAGLRVVDTSLFPELPSGNTNAPAMAAGRNVARMMLAER